MPRRASEDKTSATGMNKPLFNICKPPERVRSRLIEWSIPARKLLPQLTQRLAFQCHGDPKRMVRKEAHDALE
eukprot:scaffold6613_cov188-Prasinococcus_capsulatus_cf.AAC.1